MQQHHKKGPKRTTRDRNDRYETPDEEIDVVLQAMYPDSFEGPILEPACGSGRMVRRIRKYTGQKVIGRDLEDTGHDWLKTTRKWKGDMITNPPYHKDMPLQFALKAHELVDGQFAMLLQAGFLWTDTRAPYLRGILKPDQVIIIPWRIYFYRRNGKRIEGQAYSHCWVIWPDRIHRGIPGDQRKTKITIAERSS